MNEAAKFGRLARAYRWMEYFSFGPYLAQCRKVRLDEVTRHHRALIYGDGDGRFVADLVTHAAEIQVAAIDASAEMLHEAARRTPDRSRVRLIHANALVCEPVSFPEAPFDLVVSHFFLDCFSELEIAQLLARVRLAVCENAIWIVSDFAIPRQSPARQMAALIVRSLYFAFGSLTGLSTRRLPDHGRLMREAGWILEDCRKLVFGLLISERWRLSSPQKTALL
jgi:ubiquinone/menaquinone biosynthesis C-methylase UbiE